MVDEADELEKVKRNVRLQWQELHAEFPESDRASVAYLAGFHRIQSYDQVQSSAALRIPFAGRFVDAAVDAKTSVRLLELILERQSRTEQKVEQLLLGQRQLSNLALVVCATLIGYLGFSWFAG